jgi:hypothetical protein
VDETPKVEGEAGVPPAPLEVDERLMDDDPRSYSLFDGWRDDEGATSGDRRRRR